MMFYFLRHQSYKKICTVESNKESSTLFILIRNFNYLKILQTANKPIKNVILNL